MTRFGPAKQVFVSNAEKGSADLGAHGDGSFELDEQCHQSIGSSDTGLWGLRALRVSTPDGL